MSGKAKLWSWLAYHCYLRHPHFDQVLARRWQWRRYLARNRRVLEVGPGGGVWTLELLRRGNSVTVVDVSAASLSALQAKLARFPLKNRDIRLVRSHAADYSSRETYDQVVLFEVLEHIAEDGRAVRNLAGHLSPGGEMLISVPHSGHIPLEGECISEQEDGRHVRKGYSREGLEELLRREGLEVVGCETAAGYFTRRLEDLSNRAYRITGSRMVLYLLRILSRPLLHLDFLRPDYPPYTLFVIAVRRGG